MPWKLPSLRDRRAQVRDAFAANLPGADATQPNSVLRVVGDAQALLVHDNDQHLAWLARMMMPDSAEGEYIERWANIWLPLGRKGASGATGAVAVTGSIGAVVPTDAILTAAVTDRAGVRRSVEYRVTSGVTLSSTSAVVPVAAVTTGDVTNLDEGVRLAFSSPPDNIDGQAIVAAPGLAGGADIEPDISLRSRTIDRIQKPPHGGAAHDYVQWALEVPGVTRAWARQEMGVGTVTVRVMLDQVRGSGGGFPLSEDLDLVKQYLDALRPVTVADLFVVSPIAQPINLTIADLVGDTPEVRKAVRDELLAMLASRAAPGQMIFASWVREAISAATGEDHHDIAISNVAPVSSGHIITLGSITFA